LYIQGGSALWKKRSKIPVCWAILNDFGESKQATVDALRNTCSSSMGSHRDLGSNCSTIAPGFCAGRMIRFRNLEIRSLQ
jgi:hypothetical protein